MSDSDWTLSQSSYGDSQSSDWSYSSLSADESLHSSDWTLSSDSQSSDSDWTLSQSSYSDSVEYEKNDSPGLL